MAGTFRLQMTPDDDRYNSPRSIGAKLSLGPTPPEGRDALELARHKMQVREEELNEQVHASYHNFEIVLSRSSKKKKPLDQDYFDSSCSSSVNRTLDYDLNSSSLSAYDADSEQVESGAEQAQRRRLGSRLPRASIAPGATKIPEPSRSFKPPPRMGNRPEIPGSGMMRSRRMSLIPNINPPAPSAKAARSTSKRALARTPRGDLI